jgi:L-2-hydroxyglutarate oxidase
VSFVRFFSAPQTGIIDYKVSKNMLIYFFKWEYEIYFNQKVQGIVSNGNSAVVQTLNTEFEAGRIVNCAGLYSDRLRK